MGGSGSSSSSFKSSTKTPWGTAEPFFGPMYQKAWDTINNAMSMGQQPFTGNFKAEAPSNVVSDASRYMTEAFNNIRRGGGGQALQNLALKTAKGGFLPSGQYEMNPQLQNVMDIAAGRTKEQFTQGVLPNIRDAAIAGGAYGGARQDIQENQASQQFGRAANEATQQIGYQDYNDFMNRYATMWNQERGRMQGAGEIFNAANQQFMAPSQVKAAQGQYLQDKRQVQTDNMLQRWMDMHRVAPGFGFNMLPQMAGILTAGDYGNTTEIGTQKSKTSGGGLDIFKSGLGALGSIASLAAK